MQPQTRNILTAVTIEVVTAILVFSFFHILFFGVQATLEIKAFLFPIFSGIACAYGSGWLIGNNLIIQNGYKVWHGVAIIFTILLIAVVAGTLSVNLTQQLDGIKNLSGLLSVILVFLIFGSLPTLAIGLWLGKCLKQMKK